MKRFTMVLIITLFVCIVHPVLAADLWTKTDTYREITFVAITIADWNQTLHVADHPEKWKELNPILGEHPSRGEVSIYMGTSIILHAAIAYILPQPYRTWWQYAWIGIETAAVGNNLSVGIGIGY
jgi:hypothetical protein